MECYMVNNQMPGPLIEANWGDWIEVTVTNAVETEGTSIHWHGFLQKGTAWMDGVPGVSQCPVRFSFVTISFASVLILNLDCSGRFFHVSVPSTALR